MAGAADSVGGLGWAASALAGARLISDGCDGALLSTPAVATVRKHASNPENLLAGSFQRTLEESCGLLAEGHPLLRKYVELCGAEPEKDLKAARSVLQLRSLVCGKSVVSNAVLPEWSCWTPLTSSFWSCSQKADWSADPQACTLLERMADCYARVAQKACGEGSAGVLRAVVLRTLADVPQCPNLSRATPPKAHSWAMMSFFLVVGLLGNMALAVVVFICCMRWRKRRKVAVAPDSDPEPDSGQADYTYRD